MSKSTPTRINSITPIGMGWGNSAWIKTLVYPHSKVDSAKRLTKWFLYVWWVVIMKYNTQTNQLKKIISVDKRHWTE